VNPGLKILFRPRSIIAVALMFWCAGTACMMVSYARVANVDSSQSSQSTAVRMSMDVHACCKARHKSAKRVVTSTAHGQPQSADVDSRLFTLPEPTQSGSMSCCPLSTGSILVSSRTQTNTEAPALAETGSLFDSEESTPPLLIVPLRLPNRAQSYLLDCVFLI
jgi:hypothetical protein